MSDDIPDIPVPNTGVKHRIETEGDGQTLHNPLELIKRYNAAMELSEISVEEYGRGAVAMLSAQAALLNQVAFDIFTMQAVKDDNPKKGRLKGVGVYRKYPKEFEWGMKAMKESRVAQLQAFELLVKAATHERMMRDSEIPSKGEVVNSDTPPAEEDERTRRQREAWEKQREKAASG